MLFLEKTYIYPISYEENAPSLGSQIQEMYDILNTYEDVMSIHVEGRIIAMKTFDYKVKQINPGKPFGYILRSIRTKTDSDMDLLEAEKKV